MASVSIHTYIRRQTNETDRPERMKEGMIVSALEGARARSIPEGRRAVGLGLKLLHLSYMY